jgi:outer membrane protein assembly factor BamB
MTADELTSQTGIAGGLCAFPQATQQDAELALELAQRPTFIVCVMAKEEDQVARIRADATVAGVLGRTFYVEQGNAASLPFASRLVDLMVISNLSDADLTPERRSEWLRVIAPVRGLALVGCAGATGSRLSKGKLKAWAENLPLTKVQDDDSGVWVWLRARLPAGSDAWTHRLHGPESSQISMDTALQSPFLTQWWGLPRLAGFWGSTSVSCNGRIFYINSNRQVGSDPGTFDFSLLTARRLNNGIVLWQRELRGDDKYRKLKDGGYIPWRSCAVATEDSLFLIDRDNVLQLDAETGAERRGIPGPKSAGQVKWIALVGKRLAVMAGDPDNIFSPSYFQNNPKVPVFGTPGFESISDNPMGRELAVYDTETGKVLWRDTVKGDIDQRSIVMCDQRLYCLAEGVGLTCRDLENGKVLWTNSDAELQSQYKVSFLLKNRKGHTGLPVLSAYKDILILRSVGSKMMVLSRQTGALLWSTLSVSYCVCGDILLYPFGKKPLNLMTGSETTGPGYIGTGCGPTISTPNYLIAGFGRVTDAKSNRIIRTEDAKGPCDMSTIVSEGMMASLPSSCHCNYELKGFRVLVSAGNIKPHTAPPWKERLAVFDTAEPQPLKISAADWPTYRHDPQRSGGSAATVGEQPKKILWQSKASGMEPYSKPYAFECGFKPDFLATAPVAVEGLVWFGLHDGMIRCVKADTGAEVWSFATKSMLFTPPTLWHGRLLAGSGDGCVYCLDARTGKCLWRLQAAPLDRRVFWYGHLINTWPVLPGVVVQDNIAYTLAGYQKENGVHAYAFNPHNGQVIWEKDDVGAIPTVLQEKMYGGPPWGPHMSWAGGISTGNMDGRFGKMFLFNKWDQEWAGLSCLGSVALGANELWLTTGCLDLKNGDNKEFGVKYGGEVGVFDKWVLQGGRRISETEDTLFEPAGCSEISISTLSGNEDKMTGINLTESGISLPVWDADHILLPRKLKPIWPPPDAVVSLVPRAKFTAWVTEHTASQAALKEKKEVKKKEVPDLWAQIKQWSTEDFKSSRPIENRPREPVSFALAKDQAVVAYTDGKSYKLGGYLRANGKKAWTVDLPEQPAMNRLALDRNGRVLVSLCDGSVVCVGQ